MPSPPVETRCYVLSPEGRAPGTDLVDLIDRRGWTVEIADDPLATLADVAGLERTETHRSAWGLRRRIDQALVVVPPEHAGGFGEIGALIDALRRYLPELPAWLYAAGGLSPLTPGGRLREETNGAPASAGPVFARVPGPDGDEAPAPAPDSAVTPPPALAAEVPTPLEADEIRMLLNRDRGDDRTEEHVAAPAAAPPPPDSPSLPSAFAAPGVELRLAGPMTPEDFPPEDLPPEDPSTGDQPLEDLSTDALTDDPTDTAPDRITAEEMHMLFEPDPEAPARS